MTPEALATLHAQAFAGPPRPWTAREFAELQQDNAVDILHEDGLAFIVIRRAGPEAEVLTLCTKPAARRQGHAARLLALAEDRVAQAGVVEMFLEVAETNRPAQALYAAAGFTQRGHRKNYYTHAGRAHVSALVLGKRLT